MQPTENRIRSYIQCAQCVKESKQCAHELRCNLLIGYTEKGFQAWCEKHKITVSFMTHEDLKNRINQVWEGYL